VLSDVFNVTLIDHREKTIAFISNLQVL